MTSGHRISQVRTPRWMVNRPGSVNGPPGKIPQAFVHGLFTEWGAVSPSLKIASGPLGVARKGLDSRPAGRHIFLVRPELFAQPASRSRGVLFLARADSKKTVATMTSFAPAAASPLHRTFISVHRRQRIAKLKNGASREVLSRHFCNWPPSKLWPTKSLVTSRRDVAAGAKEEVIRAGVLHGIAECRGDWSVETSGSFRGFWIGFIFQLPRVPPGGGVRWVSLGWSSPAPV
jgi:hypothetical protein